MVFLFSTPQLSCYRDQFYRTNVDKRVETKVKPESTQEHWSIKGKEQMEGKKTVLY